MASPNLDSCTQEELDYIVKHMKSYKPVDVGGVAIMLNQTLRCVRNWANRADDPDNELRLVLGRPFPEPVHRGRDGKTPRGRIWDAPDIAHWAVLVGIATKKGKE